MTSYLVDTNVISVFAPGKAGDPQEAEAVRRWLEEHTDELFLSAVTVMELQSGIAKAQRTGAPRADRLSAWLDEILHHYGDRVVPFDGAAAILAGSLADEARGKGRHPGLADIIIAATAGAHEMTVVTRNVAHFWWRSVVVHNPFPS